MMSEEMRSRQIEMLIRFYNMQAGTAYRVGKQENRDAVSGAIGRADGDIVAIKNFVREWVSAHKDEEVSVIDCFDAFKKEEPAPAPVVEEVQAQPVDLKRISFPLTHTGFFRVIGFDWYSKTPKGKYRYFYGHAIGCEDSVKSKLPAMFKEMFGSNAVFVSGAELLQKGDKGEEYLKEVFTKCGNGIKA